jgi:hypothetical protein
MVQRTSLSEVFPAPDSGVTGMGQRVYYAMLSRNTSSTFNGAALYNQNFDSFYNQGLQYARNQYARSHIIQNVDGTYQYSGSIWESVYSGTQSYPGSSGTSTYVNSTNASGEFGNAMVDAYSDGTLSHIYGRTSDVGMSIKHYLNAHAINSDHLNKRIVYLLISGVIRAVDRLYGAYSPAMENTGDFSIPSVNGTMQGSASYHRKRKELTIVSYQSSGGSYNCFTYSNVDFDRYPDPYVALNRPEVTRVDATLSLASNWQTNDSESYYNLKPITTDNGNVYVTVMFQSTNFTLYRFTRSGTSAITATYITGQSLTTSYGKDQGIPYGQRQMTSRDGTSVATFCPYYYYGCGMRCFMIDKTNNTYTTYGTTDTSYGRQILPYGDDGWAFYYCGNLYSSNYSGTTITTYVRQYSGGHVQDGQNKNGYWTYTTGPNTTNYPGFTQVVDYVMLPSNKYGPR